MQMELRTISQMRDAKAGTMQEIRDITDTKEKKKGAMEVSVVMVTRLLLW